MKSRVSTFFGLLLLVLLSLGFVENQSLATDELENSNPEVKPLDLSAIDDLVAQAIAEQKLPGAVVAIGFRGEQVWNKAYGNRQVEPQPEPMTVDTVFDLASLTKPIATATSLMILSGRGEIDLNDPVAKYVPEFGSKEKDAVTIEQLMLHIGGMIPDNAMSDYQGSPDESIAKLMNLGLNYPPKTRFRYSDVGFQVLAELVRNKTGKDIKEFSHDEIFRPLGMDETSFLPNQALHDRCAPTQQRGGKWMQGEVHDPRAYAVGGVAGHAGLFSTAADLSRYAQMMVKHGTLGDAAILSPDSFNRMTKQYPVPGGIRGLGWDKQSGYSSNRGKSMSDSAFGHGGFTGTAIWIDPELELYVIFLSNRVHPNGSGSVNGLAGQIGTIAADAVLELRRQEKSEASSATVLCGIDVLARDQFRQLAGRRIGLITNHTGVDQSGTLTSTLLHQASNVELRTLLSPEHGIAGLLDQPTIGDSTHPTTGVRVQSLYGSTRRPTAEMLEGVDTLVFDIQDIGTRFYTYIATMGESMQAAEEQKIRFVVLDRPNPINGLDVAGPMRDDNSQSFVAYHNLPVRHGMTVGELAMMFKAERFPNVDLQVIRCEGWQRSGFYDQTGLYWINPSPNMRNLNQAILYPGIGLLEYSNLSVGRGTDTPFEIIGAPWINAGSLAADLNAMKLPGITFIPERFTPDSSKYQNEVCEGIQLIITDRSLVEPVKIGLAIAITIHKNHGDDWESKLMSKLLCSDAVLKKIQTGEPLEEIMACSDLGVDAFLARRERFLLYDAEVVDQAPNQKPFGITRLTPSR